MSEYQYYEFVAIDRPLTAKEIEEVGKISTRADITATRFTNEYHFGDFRGEPKEFLRKWYDAMVYYANWGTRRVMFRVPADVIDVSFAKSCCASDSAKMIRAGDNLIFDFTLSPDDGGDDYLEDEDASPMTEVIALREELLRGDPRVLYLGWLLSVTAGDVDDKELEPAVPPGLMRLSRPLKAVARFLEIDEDLLRVAAEVSRPAAAPREDLAAWIARLPAEQKDQFILAACTGSDPHIGAKLQRQFQSQQAATLPSSGVALRAAGALRQAAARRGEEIAQGLQRLNAEKRAREEAEAAVRRAQDLDHLSKRQDLTWREIEELIESRQQKGYDQALTLLKDLRDLSTRDGNSHAFLQRVHLLRSRHIKKSSFIGRLSKAIGVPNT